MDYTWHGCVQDISRKGAIQMLRFVFLEGFCWGLKGSECWAWSYLHDGLLASAVSGQDVKATDEELEAVQAELEAMRQSSSIMTSAIGNSGSSETLPLTGSYLADLPGPPGLTPISPEQIAEQLRATIRAATAALRELEEKIQPERLISPTNTSPPRSIADIAFLKSKQNTDNNDIFGNTWKHQQTPHG